MKERVSSTFSLLRLSRSQPIVTAIKVIAVSPATAMQTVFYSPPLPTQLNPITHITK
ncbi:unnamed protein product [Brassica rapa subsp. trilocularis]